jgi:hypothetical protein
MDDVCACEACSEEGGIRGVTCICYEGLCAVCGCCPYHCECDEDDLAAYERSEVSNG